MSNRVFEGNKRFGRLLVVSFAYVNYNQQTCWNCKCDCGETVIVPKASLRYGNTTSCGCARGESHGLSYTSTYRSWQAMKARCYNPNNSRYLNYGGRGIKVCDRWRNSFVAFFEDVGKKPSSKHSIERMDNDGNYEPGNCYWATPKEQANNTKRNIIIEFNGKKQSISKWVDEIGINRKTLYGRLFSYGWSVERALTEEVNIKCRKKGG